MKVNKRRENTREDRSPDIFDTEEAGGRNEEYVEEEEELDPEEEQEKEEEKSSSSEDGGELEDDEPDYDAWSPLRKEVGKDIEEPYTKQIQRFMVKGKNQTYAEDAAFKTLLPVSRRRLRRFYLQCLKWIHRIKHDALHRKVKKTLQHFIDEDNVDFDEAVESAVDTRKFLLNRVIGKKILSENWDDDEEKEEASVWYTEIEYLP